ncbi:carboxymuconolactone decarboxylase family protein [Salinimicrobium soli]|uniref:carboxymuconolactone decarboxylase family protein n=1 Tax=Salinimicrobium soli TaxID=1254399 RepID=UPI003AACE347
MSTSISLSKNGNSPFEKLLGHNDEILQKWNELENAFFETSGLDSHLLEQVRRTLAFGNGCEYCMAKAGKPDFDENNQRIKAATAFAELFAIDHKAIAAPHFDYLREYFSEKEISVLCSFISFLTASQRFGKIMNLTEDLQPEKGAIQN